MNLAEKKIWITGASSGLGAELAIQLSSVGASVILSGRNLELLKEVSTKCVGDTRIIDFDLSSTIERNDAFSTYSTELSDVDIVIHNAGVSQRSFTYQTDFEVYNYIMETNYLGPVSISLKMLDFFRSKKNGHFVVISSMAGKFGVPMRSGYSASKMALQGFFETLFVENNDKGIAVTFVYPSFIKTKIGQNALTGNGTAYNSDDNEHKSGISVQKSAQIIIKKIQKRQLVVYIGKWKETKFANLLHFVFPKHFYKLLRKKLKK